MNNQKTMKRIKNIIFILNSIFLLLFIGYVFLGPFSKISIVELKTDGKLKNIKSYTKQEEKILSFLNSYKGQFLWQADLKKIVKKINGFYLGTEVYVVRRFPNRLIVSLKKKNTALLLLKEGEFFYSVSYEGEIGSQRNREESFDFPILRGSAFWNNLQLRKRVLSILSSLPKKDVFFSIQNLSEISYNKNNDSLFFHLISGHFILELKGQLDSKKIKNIDFVLNYLDQYGHQRGFIDARFDKKIIVKNLN